MAGTITRTPDLLDRLTKEVTPQGTVSYTYDNADRRETMTVAGQTAVSYTFDNANRLTQISQSGTGTLGFTYDNADRRTLLTLPDAATQAYVYDSGGHGDSHVTSLTYKHSTTTIGTLTYTYDPDGRRSTVGGSLAAVTIPTAYECTNTYNADNEMTKYCGVDDAFAVPTYDSNGQMTSDGPDTYTWDTRRHLSAIGGYSSATYVGACPERSRRNALGRRMSKNIAGTTTQFLYDGLNPLQELNSSGGVIANMLTGLNIDEYFTRTEPACCGALSYLTDALGSTESMANSSGTVEVQYQYDPFGDTALTLLNDATTNSYQFTGRENDGIGIADDLYYYCGRYYNAAFQRFLSQDPLDFAGGDTNLYGYVNQNPVTFTDPTGLIVFFFGGGYSEATGSKGSNSSLGHFYDTSNAVFGKFYSEGSTSGFGSGTGVYGGIRLGDYTSFVGSFSSETVGVPLGDFSRITNSGGSVFSAGLSLGLPFGFTKSTGSTDLSAPAAGPRCNITPQIESSEPSFSAPYSFVAPTNR